MHTSSLNPTNDLTKDNYYLFLRNRIIWCSVIMALSLLMPFVTFSLWWNLAAGLLFGDRLSVAHSALRDIRKYTMWWNDRVAELQNQEQKK